MDARASRQATLSTSRRSFLLGAGSMLALPLVGCGGDDDIARPLLAETSSGLLNGQVSGSVVAYKGIPYAQAPACAPRASRPQPSPPATVAPSSVSVSVPSTALPFSNPTSRPPPAPTLWFWPSNPR